MIERDNLERQTLDFIRKHRLLEGTGKLVVAVSGGPDSVCLLQVLLNLRSELGVVLHVAHLDHGLRGDDSKADAAYVRQLAAQAGVPATVETRDVKAHRRDGRLTLEEAAREVRYAFLAEVASSVGAKAVAVGHTRDDNVETILMHLIRGTGTRGLQGLLPVHDLRTPSGSLAVVRPLLDISRMETAAYCAGHGLSPRHDETNLSLSLFRNSVRLELLPSLRRYNPRIEDALSRTARISRDELAFLDKEAARVWGRLASVEGETVILKRGSFVRLAPALKRHVLRLAVAKLLGDLKDIEARHIEELLEATRAAPGRAFHLPFGLVFVVEYDRYLLGRNVASACPFPPLEEFQLCVPGETIASGWKVTASISPRESLCAGSPESGGLDWHSTQSLPLPGQRLPPSGESKGKEVPRPAHGGRSSPSPELLLKECFDLARIGDRLTVRPVRPGDRFEPLGLGASKKVGEFMLDAKIPRLWRTRVPVVVTPAQVAWVVGWRIDGRLRVTESTGTVLCLEFKRLR